MFEVAIEADKWSSRGFQGLLKNSAWFEVDRLYDNVAISHVHLESKIYC